MPVGFGGVFNGVVEEYLELLLNAIACKFFGVSLFDWVHFLVHVLSHVMFATITDCGVIFIVTPVAFDDVCSKPQVCVCGIK